MSGGVDANMRLSVLDLVPVRTDQTTADALARTSQRWRPRSAG